MLIKSNRLEISLRVRAPNRRERRRRPGGEGKPGRSEVPPFYGYQINLDRGKPIRNGQNQTIRLTLVDVRRLAGRKDVDVLPPYPWWVWGGSRYPRARLPTRAPYGRERIVQAALHATNPLYFGPTPSSLTKRSGH